jgi:phosphoglycerate dehydrogenase-like enzyme
MIAFAAIACLCPAQQKKIVVFGLPSSSIQELQAASPGAIVVAATDADGAAKLADADGAISPPAQLLSGAKNLKWVQTSSAGVERYAPLLKDRPVVLTNCKIVQGPNIADHAMALLLVLTRDLHSVIPNLPKEEWTRSAYRGVELSGKTAVIIGVGGIGMQIAQRAHAFGMNVIGVDPKDISYTYFLKKVVPPDRLDTVLPEANVVFVSAPLTAQTKGMMGDKQFQLMKQNSYFVAVSRGELYSTDALMKALDSKRLAGAGLDVTNPEPLPKGHPLWKFRNVVITPHIAGSSDVVSGRRLELYKENIRRFLSGEPMLNVVDKERGY